MNKNGFTVEDAVFIDGGDDTAAEAKSKRKGEFPGRSARRMTHLGIMVGLCIKRLNTFLETPIIYASAFAESSSLEKFIDSFPQASPALFQSSIHPSAVEQALIQKKQAIRKFYPITSDSNLAGQLLENSFLLSDDKILILGGEERGTWLCPYDLASTESFAFGMLLSRKGSGIGTLDLDFHPNGVATKTAMLPALATSIEKRQELSLHSHAFNARIRLKWT